MQKYNFDQSTTCFYHSLWSSHCMMFYPYKSAKGVCISMHYFAQISKYTYSPRNMVSTCTLIWIALSSNSTNANFEITCTQKSTTNNLIGQLYWTALLNNLISYKGLDMYVLTYSTYILDVLWCQPIKLIHVVSTSEFHAYWWNDIDFIFFVPSI